jgi:glycosyltransferase involved in cell wall biosynthesis
MQVVALIPAYQAAGSVGRVVEALRRLWPEAGANVVVVDDGSTDGTSEQAARAGAVVVRHSKNLGKGAALRTGLAKALELGAEAAVSLDADGQHPPDQAVRLALDPSPMSTLLLGVRDLRAAGAPRAHLFSNGISNFFLSRFAGQKLRDTQCGLRRYPVAPALGLEGCSAGYAYEAEILLLAARAGWQISELPIEVLYDAQSRLASHFDVVRDPARIVARVLLTLCSGRCCP